MSLRSLVNPTISRRKSFPSAWIERYSMRLMTPNQEDLMMYHRLFCFQEPRFKQARDGSCVLLLVILQLKDKFWQLLLPSPRSKHLFRKNLMSSLRISVESECMLHF